MACASFELLISFKMSLVMRTPIHRPTTYNVLNETNIIHYRSEYVGKLITIKRALITYQDIDEFASFMMHLNIALNE